MDKSNVTTLRGRKDADPSAGYVTRLPAPWSDAKARVHPCLLHICVEYTGLPDTLIAAGAIEPEMALTVGRLGRRRVDSHGFSFGLHRRKGRVSIRVMRYIEDIGIARSLPGVRPDVAFDVPYTSAPEADPIPRHPLSRREFCCGDEGGLLGTVTMVARGAHPRWPDSLPLESVYRIENHVRSIVAEFDKCDARRPRLRLVVDNDAKAAQ